MRATAATMGMVAWPPQVIRLISGASRWSSRLTTGTTDGPSLAGVRSTLSRPAAASRGAWARWAAAEVASKTIVSAGAAASSQSIPSADAAMPASRARARPGDCGSIPTTATSSRTSDRRSLAIRSVPMLPVPRIMQGRLRFTSMSVTKPVSDRPCSFTSRAFRAPEPSVVQADSGFDDRQQVHRLAEVEHLLHVPGGLHAAGGHRLRTVHRALRQFDHGRVVELEVDVDVVAMTSGDVDTGAVPLHGEPVGFGAVFHVDLERCGDSLAGLGELGVGVAGLGQRLGPLVRQELDSHGSSS